MLLPPGSWTRRTYRSPAPFSFGVTKRRSTTLSDAKTVVSRRRGAGLGGGVTFAITVDTGGTFSDLVLADTERILGLYKVPTTPADVFEGVHEALRLAAGDHGLTVEQLLSDTRSFVYATTTATNAMLEGRTARTAFITTDGHRDILLYREGGKADPLNIRGPLPRAVRAAITHLHRGRADPGRRHRRHAPR